jgi:hypothetical protein
VMLNQQSLELGHVGRQSVDIEHAVIIPATGPACARDWLFLQHFSTHFSISSSSYPWPRLPSRRACRCDTIRINARERRAPRASPINHLEQHQQLRARQCDRARRGFLSNRLRINAVVLLVCADEPDVHNPIRIKDN